MTEIPTYLAKIRDTPKERGVAYDSDQPKQHVSEYVQNHRGVVACECKRSRYPSPGIKPGSMKMLRASGPSKEASRGSRPLDDILLGTRDRTGLRALLQSLDGVM